MADIERVWLQRLRNKSRTNKNKSWLFTLPCRTRTILSPPAWPAVVCSRWYRRGAHPETSNGWYRRCSRSGRTAQARGLCSSLGLRPAAGPERRFRRRRRRPGDSGWRKRAAGAQRGAALFHLRHGAGCAPPSRRKSRHARRGRAMQALRRCRQFMQQRLNLLPLPQGQGELRPSLFSDRPCDFFGACRRQNCRTAQTASPMKSMASRHWSSCSCWS